MSKRTYNVQEDTGAAPARDASFRSCLCALLIFLAICIIIAVIGTTWPRSHTKPIMKEKEDVDDFGTYDKLNKDKDKYKEWTGSTSTSATVIHKKPNEQDKTPSTTSGFTKSTTSKEMAPIVTTSTLSTVNVNIDNKTNAQGTISTTTIGVPKNTPLKESPPMGITTTSTTPSTPTVVVNKNNKTNVEDNILTTTTSSTKTTVAGIVPPVHSTEFSVEPAEAAKNQTTSEAAKSKSTTTMTQDPITNKWITVLGNKISNTTVSTPTTETTVDLSYMESSTDDSTLSTIMTMFDSTDISSTIDLELTTDVIPSSSEETGSSEYSTFMTESNNKVGHHKQSINDEKTTNEIILMPLLTTTTEEIISEADEFDESYNTMETEQSKNEKRSMDQDTTTEKRVTGDKQTTLKTTTKPTPVSPNKLEPVCSTSGCKSAASRMLSLMDHSEDACENFYEFSCGGMQAEGNADSDAWKGLSGQLNNINDKSPVFLRKLKQFYDSCVAYEDAFDFKGRIKSVRELLSRIGKIVDDQENITQDDLTYLFAKMILSKSMPLMDIGIDVDKETSKYILQLTLPQKSSPSNEIEQWSALLETERRCLREERHQIYGPNLNLLKIHESYSKCSKDYTDYLISINSTIEALEIYTNMPAYNITQKLEGLRFVIEGDILSLISSGPSEIHSKKETISKHFVVKKISYLQLDYPLLNWEKLFTILTHHRVTADTPVQVYFHKHFLTMFSELSTVPIRKLNNALLAIYAYDLFQNLVVSTHRNDRESFCLKSTEILFPDLSSYLYMNSLPKLVISNGEELIRKIFGKLKSNLIDGFHAVEWLDDASRISIIKKADTLEVYTPKKDDACFTDGFLNMKYNNVLLNANYQANLITMKEESRHNKYALEGEPFKPEYMFCHFVNAYSKLPNSFYSKQVIAAPFGLIGGIPKNFPGYLSMARVGIHLARDIARHFDPVGITHNMKLTDASKTKYDVLEVTLNVFKFQVTRSHGPHTVSFQLAEDLQLNTKIAENTALRLVTNVYDSLGDNKNLPWIYTTYPKEKAFFIAVAQEYCQKTNGLEYMLQLYETELSPVSLRVENIILNSQKFSEVFRCPEGSKMNTNDNQKLQFPYIPKTDYEYT